MDVVVPHLLDTGVAERLEQGGYKINLDAAECVEIFEDSQVRIMKWKEHRQEGGFLFIAKSWKVPFVKKRKLRVQCHKIRADGTWGHRIIIYETVNGRKIR